MGTVNYSLENILPLLKINPLQVKMAATLARQKPLPDGAPLADSDVWFLVVADLLERLKFLKPEQRTLILSTVSGGVNPINFPPVSAVKSTQPPLVLLSFADGTFCSWSGRKCWLDLTTGETAEKLPDQPFESIAYNLSRLVRDLVAKLEQVQANGKNEQKSDE